MRPTPADYRTPVARLFDRPFSEWSKKQRKWLDAAYKSLFPSPRGRKPNPKYDHLFDERETAKVSREYPGTLGERRKTDDKVPSYTELASAAAGLPVSGKPEDEDPARQRFIRAYQRRKKTRHIPDPPQN